MQYYNIALYQYNFVNRSTCAIYILRTSLTSELYTVYFFVKKYLFLNFLNLSTNFTKTKYLIKMYLIEVSFKIVILPTHCNYICVNYLFIFILV